MADEIDRVWQTPNMQAALSMQPLSMTWQIILCPIGDLTSVSNVLWGLPEMRSRGQVGEIDPSTTVPKVPTLPYLFSSRRKTAAWAGPCMAVSA